MQCTSGCGLLALIQVILHFQFYEVASNWGSLITRWSTAPEQHQSRCLFLQMQTSWKKNFNQKSLTLTKFVVYAWTLHWKKYMLEQTNNWAPSTGKTPTSRLKQPSHPPLYISKNPKDLLQFTLSQRGIMSQKKGKISGSLQNISKYFLCLQGTQKNLLGL